MATAHAAAPSAPASSAAAVTPSDSTVLEPQPRGLYVGVGGAVAVEFANGVQCTFANVPEGAVLPVIVRRVRATATTATSIVALY